MPVRRDKSGRWRFREVVELPGGAKRRVSGTAPKHRNTRAAALKALDDKIRKLTDPAAIAVAKREEVPTFAKWFEGRFWSEWVIAEDNKAGTQGEKESAFRLHLKPELGHLRLDEIDAARIQQIKAALKAKKGRTGKPLSSKYQNNLLAVLSKALNYAVEAEVIAAAPRVRLNKVERPEIVAWEFEEYPRVIEAADAWSVPALLAGDAGLRIGEVLALRWEDVDLVGGRLTVARQIRRGQEGTPKGRKRRTVPMTSRLAAELRRLPQIRTGRVVRHDDGSEVTEGDAKHGIYRVCRLAGLEERSWHCLRHSFATHAARLGVNPWSLQRWLGHARIDETMRYVHLVEERPRPIPPEVMAAGDGLSDPDDRVIAQLGARGKGVAKRRRQVG